MLIAVSFCCRKISSDKEEAAKKEQEKVIATPHMAAPETITGKLELDDATGIIYADLWIGVSSNDFKYPGDFNVLQTGAGYKGLSFRYYDAVNNTRDTGNDTIPLHVVFSFKNDKKWAVNDSIRVMSLDENKKSIYEGLQPYFSARMDYFKNVPASYAELLDFNDQWNAKHPDNPVTTGKGDAAQKNSNTKETKKNFFTPRLTRDDGILSLKLKK
ncbi:hypothetical protein HYN59_00230 [Flavobacterium album]|uniref:Uncharacterized protein n=1 Tax=Flavobacterium album TaxID=2175091 RepID=A0A2S1QTE3_9FLAO|nr:hypothetical protein HYN59_00230 [Flavobacterium album]